MSAWRGWIETLAAAAAVCGFALLPAIPALSQSQDRGIKAIQDAKDLAGGQSSQDGARGEDEAPSMEPPKEKDDDVMARFRKAAETAARSGIPSGLSYNYGSANRRDPFVSPAETTAKGTVDTEPLPGIQGMRIQEIRMVGIIVFPDGKPRVMVMGSDNLGYWLTEGTRLRDGIILSIDPEKAEVVFRQDVTDPLAIRPYRDVPRQLYPTEEERKR